MVKVDRADVCHLFRRTLLVEAIQRYHRTFLPLIANSDALKNLFTNCGLSRSRATCNSHEDGLVVLMVVVDIAEAWLMVVG